MAVITNTFQQFQAKGVREDLSNVISNIAPEQTPFMSNIGKGSVKNTFFEWQVDTLAAVDPSNAHVEGDDQSDFDQVEPTIRLGNYAQIFKKSIVVSDTLEAVDKAGRRSEMAYQTAKRASEIKRDAESIMLGNQGADAGTSATPRLTASLQAYLKTNTNFDATSGADPVYTNVATAGRTDSSATRPFTEALLKDVIQQVWVQGGNLDMLMVGPYNKGVASTFTGIAEQRYQATGQKPTVIIGAADVYVNTGVTLQ